MKKMRVYIPALIICCMALISCKPRLYSETNAFYVYAPDNQIEIQGITQTKTNGNIPFRYAINDNQLHYISTEVIEEFKKGLYYPNTDYNFYITAANANEYYIYIRCALRINKELDNLAVHCAKYGTDRVINAIKEQAPEYIMCISSTEKQVIQGLYFQEDKLYNIPEIIIE
ncbi:MAG: hypothetical protein ACI4AI_07070 [Paludibacteraceae bacterium]